MPEKIIRRFAARSRDGTTYEVAEIQEFTRVQNLDGSSATIIGLSRLELSTGGLVTYRDAKSVETFDTGEILTVVRNLD